VLRTRCVFTIKSGRNHRHFDVNIINWKSEVVWKMLLLVTVTSDTIKVRRRACVIIMPNVLRMRWQRCAFGIMSRPTRLYFSHFATRTVDNIVRLYAAKPDIRPESRFLPTPPAFDSPVRGVHVGISPPVWHGNTRMAWLPDGEKILKISLFVLTQLTNVTDGRTNGHRVTA